LSSSTRDSLSVGRSSLIECCLLHAIPVLGIIPIASATLEVFLGASVGILPPTLALTGATL
jgi:hypothetical protein